MKYKQDLAIPSPTRHSSSNTSNRSLVSALPEECIREILLRLSDPKDVERAGDTCQTMSTIAREKRVWRELAQTHFTKQQIDSILADRPDLAADWKQLYKRLRWRFGLKEEYTEMLYLCMRCRSLYWQSFGHPCLVAESGDNSSGDEDNSSSDASLLLEIKPQKFLSFFSL